MENFEVPFGSILAPFGTLGPPKVRFFAFRGALARTFAHTARASTILSDFGCPDGGGPKVSRRLRRGPFGGEVKLHLAPLDGDIVWVSARSAISEACTACIATDLSQLPFLRCGFSNSFTGSVQEVVQWMCRRVA